MNTIPNGTLAPPRDRLLAELCLDEWQKEVSAHAGQPAELLRLNEELASQPWIMEALHPSSDTSPAPHPIPLTPDPSPSAIGPGGALMSTADAFAGWLEVESQLGSDYRLSTGTWVRDPGPRSANRWRNTASGNIEYGDKPPGHELPTHPHADYEAIPHGELGKIEGFPVRRLSESSWRMETPTGFVQGHASDVHQHIAKLKEQEEKARPLIDAALKRADEFPTYNPFTHPAESEAEEKAFTALPEGVLVVSLDPESRGRLGKIVKHTDDAGRKSTRVRLFAVPGFVSTDIEPLDRQQSWRVPGRTPKPSEPAKKQGLLFGTSPEIDDYYTIFDPEDWGDEQPPGRTDLATRDIPGQGILWNARPEWVRDPGPRSQDRWRSTKTGRIVYAKEMPGTHEHKGDDMPAPGEPAPASMIDLPEKPKGKFRLLESGQHLSEHDSEEEAHRAKGLLEKQAQRFGMNIGELTVQHPESGPAMVEEPAPTEVAPAAETVAPPQAPEKPAESETDKKAGQGSLVTRDEVKEAGRRWYDDHIRDLVAAIQAHPDGKHNIVHFGDLRDRLGWTKNEFHLAFNEGRRRGIFTGKLAEGGGKAKSLSERDKAELIAQGDGQSDLLYAGLRHGWEENMPEPKKESTPVARPQPEEKPAETVPAPEPHASAIQPSAEHPLGAIGGLTAPTAKQLHLARGMTTEQLNKSRHENEERLQGMPFNEWNGEAGTTAIRWRAAIDAELTRRSVEEQTGKPPEAAPALPEPVANEPAASPAPTNPAAAESIPPAEPVPATEDATPAPTAAEAPPEAPIQGPSAPPVTPTPSTPSPAKTATPLAEDFGEKIGGARKDIARPLGNRAKKDAGEPERPAWARRYEVSQIAGSTRPGEEGKWVVRDSKDTDWSGQPKQKGGLFNSKEEAEQAVPLMAAARNHRVQVESGTQSGGDLKFGIYRKIGDRKRALVKGGFASEEAAMKYMAANPEAVIEHKFPRYEDYAYLDHVERKGPEHKTTDVKPADFQKTFHFRGGEFGNWQKGRDGIESLNHAYDALYDLTDALGLPPKAAALNGDLAIAFGARGTGGENAARAHYEPEKRVMNLTKMNGAGSLAHEWAHALDHAIGKAGGHDGNAISSSHYKVKLRPELEAAAKHLRDTIASKTIVREREEAREAKVRDSAREALEQHFRDLETDLKGTSYRPARPLTAEQQAEWDSAKAKVLAGDVGASRFIEAKGGGRFSGRDSYEPLEELNKLYKKATGRSFHTADEHSKGKSIYWAIQRHVLANKRVEGAKAGESDTVKGKSDFYNNSLDLDRTRSGDYYSEPHEMFARAFEAYIADKLHEKGIRSDYLVSHAKTDNRSYAHVGMKPFPEGEERKTINAAFDRFFAELKHEEREDDRGKHIKLFSTEQAMPATIEQTVLVNGQRVSRKVIYLSSARAPVGGVTVAGKKYSGGEFIPGEVMAQATPEEKAKVEGKSASPDRKPESPTEEPPPERPRGHRPRGPSPSRDVDTAKLAETAHDLASANVVGTKKLKGGVNVSQIVHLEGAKFGVFKPASGEAPDMRAGIEPGTYFRREVAAFRVAEILGMADLVPVTVARKVGDQVGSVQHFVDNATPAVEAKDPWDGSEDLMRSAVFDYLIGHLDRHDGNWLIQKSGKLTLIDNGLAFPAHPAGYRKSSRSMLFDQAGADNLSVPDVSAWKEKWPAVEKACKEAGIEEPALALMRGRLEKLLAGKGNAIADLLYWE